MEQLKQYIQTLLDFPEESWPILAPALTIASFNKGQYLLEAGSVCDSLFFITKGYCRAFYLQDGAEINTTFFFEDEIVTNINSFASGEKSAFSIIAVENGSFVKFDKKKLRQAAEKDPAIEMLGKACLRRIAMKQEWEAAMYKLKTAQERYEYLEKRAPTVLQRVPLTQLSSYLGVARETLSRIRSRRLR